MTRAAPVAIVGPTAAGKSALALALAREIGGEIISMDSRQVYRMMDVGTAKPTPEERAAVPHFGLDLVDPDERYSAGQFGRDARRWIADIQGRGAVPILVGGTGFFLRSLTHPIFGEPDLDPTRRDALRAWLSSCSAETLLAWLAALDPPAAARLREWGGRQRLMRAIEIPLLTGRTLAWWQRHTPAEADPVELRVFVVDLPRAELDRTIESRVTRMVEAGLVDEVRHLLDLGYDESAPGMNATGYAEMIPVVRGERSLEAAVELVRKHTRAYSRRQLTWFRHQLPPSAVWMDGREGRDAHVAQLRRHLEGTLTRTPGMDGTSR